MENNAKPITHQGNLAQLPKALAPLIARPQWAVWRWTKKPDGSWQKPPFVAIQPERHASTTELLDRGFDIDIKVIPEAKRRVLVMGGIEKMIDPILGFLLHVVGPVWRILRPHH